MYFDNESELVQDWAVFSKDALLNFMIKGGIFCCVFFLFSLIIPILGIFFIFTNPLSNRSSLINNYHKIAQEWQYNYYPTFKFLKFESEIAGISSQIPFFTP
jgi:hypothetical protein